MLLQEAVAKGLTRMGKDEIEKAVVKLHRQVGQLEERNAALENAIRAIDTQDTQRNKRLNRQVGQLEGRNAALETAIKAISAQCVKRVVGICDVRCGGRAFCDPRGLAAVDWPRLDTQGFHTGGVIERRTPDFVVGRQLQGCRCLDLPIVVHESLLTGEMLLKVHKALLKVLQPLGFAAIEPGQRRGKP